jgi:hypothetical protein
VYGKVGGEIVDAAEVGSPAALASLVGSGRLVLAVVPDSSARMKQEPTDTSKGV